MRGRRSIAAAWFGGQSGAPGKRTALFWGEEGQGSEARPGRQAGVSGADFAPTTSRPTKSSGTVSVRRADGIRPYPRVILSDSEGSVSPVFSQGLMGRGNGFFGFASE